MLEFMEYVQTAFLEATRWRRDNSYATLTATARSILDFEIPSGLRLDVSSRATSNFATSYSLGNSGLVHGSFSYLFSSSPALDVDSTADISLRTTAPGYRQLRELQRSSRSLWVQRDKSRREALLYGRMFLPDAALEALYITRLSDSQQLKLACVSDSRLKNRGTVLAELQTDVGKYSTEILYSTDEALFGLRGLYNFGPDPRKPASDSTEKDKYGRLSAGAEIYYGALNKSGGLSTGMRFATLPAHTGVPFTMTVTANPLMGNLSSTYAVRAGKDLTLSSRINFNVYSYESDLSLGCELWRTRRKSVPFDAKLSDIDTEDSWPDPAVLQRDGSLSGVLRAKVDQNLKFGFLWEGRVKDLLFSLGSSIDLKNREQLFRGVGLSLQYTS